MLRLLATAILIVSANPAHALITGGGDEEVNVGGLPDGALALANLPTRIAWWEGPPFGGGQYHYEYSGETLDLQKAVDLFAKVDASRKRVVIQAGEQESFWLGIRDKTNKHPIDWRFVVWVPANWQRLRGAKAGLLPPGEEGAAPPTTLEIYVSRRINVKQLKIPESLKVVDKRLEANGIAADQGGALTGKVVDAQGQPIKDATVTLGKDDAQLRATSDAEGKFLITRIPEGNHQVIVSAEGFASKDKYYHAFKPTTFQRLDVSLSESTIARVRAIGQDEKPLAGVQLRISNCKDNQGNFYRIPGSRQYTTDENGEFIVTDIPKGKIKFSSRSREYYYNSVLNEHDTSESPIILKMFPTGTVEISVVNAFGKPVTSKYLVEINEKGVDPIKGGGVGSWGGSANIGSEGKHTFKNIPPGDYVVTGRPNPGRVRDRTDPIEVRIQGKDLHKIRITAK